MIPDFGNRWLCPQPDDVMRSIPVSIGGVRYSSIKAAARALGVAPATVVARLKRAGEWRDKRRKPVTVAGRHFNSVKDAATVFGVTPTTIQNRRRREQAKVTLLPAAALSPVALRFRRLTVLRA